MLLSIAAVIAGLAILVWGADRFVTGAAALADNLGVSPLLIGLTIVGFGTSAPEIVVSATAALEGNPGLAIGNAVGSNIANIGLILGATALIAPLTVNSATLKREYPVLVAVSLMSWGLVLDGRLTRVDGAILLTCLVALLYLMVRLAKASPREDPLRSEFDAEIPHRMPTREAVIALIVGLAALLISSRLLVWGATNIAQSLGVSDLIIGLTIVALGTSLPELAANITSALKNEHDIALGNIIGSNLYNLLAVLSLPGIIVPGPLAPEVVSRDMPVMVALTVIIFLMGYGFFGTRRRINRIEGSLLLTAFAAYQAALYYSVTAQSA